MRSPLNALHVTAAATLMACAPEQVVEPYRPPPVAPVPGEAQLASTRLSRIGPLIEGDTVRLDAIPLDARGAKILAPYTVSYQAHDPAVATVSETGLVTAVASGWTDISATIVIGRSMSSDWVRAYVFAPAFPDSILLTSGERGWEPSQAQVASGGTAEWRIGALNWEGIPVNYVYVMDRFNNMDSVAVTNGSAKLRLESRGLYHYCSGVCWDPPDWGVIYVR